MKQIELLAYSEKTDITISYNCFKDKFEFHNGHDERLSGLKFGIAESEQNIADKTFKPFYDYCIDREPSFDNIKWLKLFSTYNCNLDCKYCIVKHYEKLQGPQNISSELPPIEYIQEFLSDHKTIDSILFSGGEPLLVFKDIKKIAESFKDYHIRINTNGLLLNEEIVEFILSRGNIVLHISIDYIDKECDWRKNIAGDDTQILLRKKISSLIEKFPTLSNHVVLNQLIQPGNEIDFTEVEEFITAHNIQRRSIKVPQHVDTIKEDFNNHQFIVQLHDWLIKNPNKQWYMGSIFMPNIHDQHFLYSGKSHFKTSWETTLVFMDKTGGMSRCPHIYIFEGKVKDKSSITHDMIYFGNYKKLDKEVYKKNLIGTFNICSSLYCSKCPIRAYCGMYGDAYSIVCTNSSEDLDLYCVYYNIMFAFNLHRSMEEMGLKYIEYLENFNSRLEEFYGSRLSDRN